MPKITALKSGLVTAAALASALGLVGSASAAGTWTVSGFPASGATTGTSANSVLTDQRSGAQFRCTSASATITGMNGTGLSGIAIMKITAATWSNCSASGVTFTVTAQNLPWNINAVTYDDITGTTMGTLTDFEAHGSGGGCTVDFRETTLNFSFANSTHKLSIPATVGNLFVSNVSGLCLGLINTGDPVTYQADVGFSDPVTLTSP